MSKVSMTLILCLNAGMFGKKINLPDMGEVEIGDNGALEVTDAVADMLINDEPDCSWAYHIEEGEIDEGEDEELEEEEEVKVVPKKTAKKSKSDKTKEKAKTTDTEAESEEISQIKDNLKKLTAEELVEMAEKAKYSVGEYEKYKNNKSLMVAYLVKKATEEN